jgi:hypothetical protein
MFLAAFTGTARAVTSTQLVIQPSSGSYAFYLGYTTPPATLTYNITVLNVANVSAWQTAIQWNSSLLGYNTTIITSASLFPINALDDSQSANGLIVVGGQQAIGATPFSGNITLAQLQLNCNPPTPPVSTSITFEGLQENGDTFLLSGLVEIPFTPVTSVFSITSVPGTPETHSISGTANLVSTYSNATIQQNTATINTTSKTVSFNVTGNTGDTAYLYLSLPKNVINCTDISHWNITLNGVKYGMSSSTFQVLADNATLTFLYIPSFTFGSQVNVGVQGDNIIPELPNVLLILLIASSATVAMMRVRTKKKI